MVILQTLRSKLGRKLRPRREVDVSSPDDLVELAHWIDRPALRLMVPPALLRMQGAYVYGAAHPFVRALNDGEAALRSFYQVCQPKTVCDFYALDGQGRLGADLPPWELPWYGRSQRTPPPGELGLAAEHGVSFYGPATDRKIALELERLRRLRLAVAENGYDPDAHGDIEGYVLNDGKDAVFFVRGGKHRAAVLAAMGHERIPVAFRSTFPRMIHAADSRRWPLVRSGGMDFSLAAEILGAYIRGQ